MLASFRNWHFLQPFSSRKTPVLLVALIFIGLTVLFFGLPAIAHWGTRVVGDGPDPLGFMWFLNWWPYAISHGLNPFWTSYLWEPLGANLLWTTSIPLPSLLAEPITQLFGVVASYNILILLSPVAAAMCAFLLFRQFAGTVPSVLGSYVFGFSSYEISQMTGHLNLTLVFVVPLLAWVWVKAFKKGHPGWVSVAAAGVMFIALFGISLELFATTIIFGTLAALLAWIVAIGSRSAILRASALVALGLAIACILLTPWLYELLTHIHNIPPGAPIFYSTDVLNWFVPTPITFLGGSAFQTVASHFGGNYSEEGGYIGLPLLAILVIVTVQRWKVSSVVRFCSLFTGITLLSSLGPMLHVDGITIMTMPWAFVYNLPLIKGCFAGTVHDVFVPWERITFSCVAGACTRVIGHVATGVVRPSRLGSKLLRFRPILAQHS